MPKPAFATAGLRLCKSTVAMEAAPITQFVWNELFRGASNGSH